MDKKEKVFRVHRALGILYGVFAVAFTAIIFTSGTTDRDGGLPLFLLVFFGAISAIHIFTGRACRQGKQGGRQASIVIACLMLFGFPLGTLIGVYLLSNTWKQWDSESALSA